jgi:hypothetical protein
MYDIISKQAAIWKIKDYIDSDPEPERVFGADHCIDLIAALPSTEPERKTGTWIKPNNQVAVAQDEWICSSCHCLVLHRHKFCPECGSYNGGTR